MKSILIRTGSAPMQASLAPGSPRPAFMSQDRPGPGISFTAGSHSVSSPRSELHFQLNEKRKLSSTFRRSASEPSLIRSKSFLVSEFRGLNRRFSRSISAMIAEEEGGPELRGLDSAEEILGSSLMLKWEAFDSGISSQVDVCAKTETLLEEIEFSGGGVGKGRKSGGGGGGDGAGESTAGGPDKSKMEAYYQEMLKANPGDPLLLRNYGKFLHEVEGDVVKAEEYYGRAILASPGDGDLLSLYGKLIWQTQRDSGRAQGYFDQAVQASPNDCYVLGSYAHFLWDAEEEDEADVEADNDRVPVRGSPLTVAF